jgi:hypothetical protein
MLTLPEDLPKTKRDLRDHLRGLQREHDWTAFQGALYGPGMKYAQPFPFAISAMKSLVAHGYELCIISHRTLHPYVGPSYNLHEFAIQWIEMWLQSEGLFLDNAFSFYETLEDKVLAIGRARCSAFLDDLPAVFEHAAFPKETLALQFFPGGFGTEPSHIKIVQKWDDLFLVLEQLS